MTAQPSSLDQIAAAAPQPATGGGAQLLAALSSALPQPVIVVRLSDQRIVDVNPAWSTMSGWERDAVVGRGVTEFDFWVDPDVPRQLSALREQHGSVEWFAARVRSRSGAVQQIAITSNVVQIDGEACVVSVSELITERPRRQAARHDDEERFYALFAHSPDAVVMIDPHAPDVAWPIVECNAAACRMNGYTRAELLGRPIDSLNLAPTEPAERLRYLERVRREGRLQFEDIHRRKDGSTFPVEISTSVVTIAGRELLLGIDRDISERKQAEARASAQAARLEVLAAAARAFAECGADYRAALASTVQIAAATLSDSCVVQLLSEDGLALETAALAHPDPAVLDYLNAELLGCALPLSELAAGRRIFDENQALLVAPEHMAQFRLQTIPALRHMLEQTGVRCLIIAPIRIEQRIIGLLSFLRFRPDLPAYDVADRQMVQNLAERAALSIGKAQLLGQVQRELAERKQAEAALRASEERFRLLAENSQDVILHYRWSRPRGFEYVSPSAVALSGYTPAEHYADADILLRIVHPDDHALLMAVGRGEHGVEPQELRILTKQGELRWAELRSVLLYDERGRPTAVHSTVRNVTERKQAEAALREREEQYRTLVENIPAIIYSGDYAGGKTYVSPQVEQILGFTQEEWTSDPGFWLSRIHPDDRERVMRNNFGDRQPGVAPPIEYRVLNSDGQLRWLYNGHWDTRPIPGGPRRVQGILLDITERKMAEAALEQERASLTDRVAERTIALSVANDELAAAVRLKDEFLANMSHELRTPLNAILGRTQLLLEELYGPLAARQIEALRSVDESGQHLLALINDVLDLARVDAGKLELHRTPLEVEALCRQCVRLVQQSAQAKRLSVRTTLDAQVTTIVADELRLKQILVNLLANAVKFTPADGAVELAVRGDVAAETVTLTVSDTGIGIEPAEQGRLFQPFVQLDGGLSRRHEGTGLGLALVRRLAEAHGGSVHLRSEPGAGSAFSVTLPWTPQPPMLPEQPHGLHAADAPERAAAAPPSPADGSVARARILLAEDNAANIELLLDCLSLKHYAVSVARTGRAAVAMASAAPPAAILMDIQMPDLDGLEAMRRIRADARLGSVPIIALTALAMPGDRERCLEAGATEYLTKPINVRALLTMLEQLLSGAHAPVRIQS